MRARRRGAATRWVMVAGGMVWAGCLLSCAPRAPRLRLDESTSWPKLCGSLAARWGHLTTLESQIRYSAETPLGNVSGLGWMGYDGTRRSWVLELRGPLGVLVLFACGSPDTLWIYTPLQNTLYVASGRGTPGGWGHWPIRAVWAALGRLPLDCAMQAHVSRHGEMLRIGVPGTSPGLDIQLDGKYGDVLRVRVQWQGANALVEYEGYRTLEGQRLPSLVRLDWAPPRARVAVSFQETRVNQPIRWSQHRIRVPASAIRLPLGELGAALEMGG
jgi:hypothetical protein